MYRHHFSVKFELTISDTLYGFPSETKYEKCQIKWDLKLRRIQKNHIEQEIEANWTKKQEVGYKSPYLEKEREHLTEHNIHTE